MLEKLTKTQLAVLTGFCKGFSLEEIAKRLDISTVRTVAVHLYQIKKKIFKKEYKQKITNQTLLLWYLRQIDVLDKNYNFKNQHLERRK